MCDFKPGDEVICVEGAAGRFPSLGWVCLAEGATYTISAVWQAGEVGETGLRCAVAIVQLVEFGHLRAAPDSPNCGFGAYRFRKVQRRDLSAWLETAATETDRWDKPIKAPAPLHPVPSVAALFRRIMAGGDR